jgi:uncharacterized protein (DUF1810 family)
MAQFDLQRFVEAQEPVYDDIRSELTAGTKTSHWMWFVFPQLQGLGRSAMAIKYEIASIQEAQAYWQHPILGIRLKECVELVLAVKGRTAFQIFGTPDDLKFRSCMTLFSKADPADPLFKRALARYFDGRDDSRTTELLARP